MEIEQNLIEPIDNIIEKSEVCTIKSEHGFFAITIQLLKNDSICLELIESIINVKYKTTITCQGIKELTSTALFELSSIDLYNLLIFAFNNVKNITNIKAEARINDSNTLVLKISVIIYNGNITRILEISLDNIPQKNIISDDEMIINPNQQKLEISLDDITQKDIKNDLETIINPLQQKNEIKIIVNELLNNMNHEITDYVQESLGNFEKKITYYDKKIKLNYEGVSRLLLGQNINKDEISQLIKKIEISDKKMNKYNLNIKEKISDYNKRISLLIEELYNTNKMVSTLADHIGFVLPKEFLLKK